MDTTTVMGNNNNHQQARHNEQACEFLQTDPRFKDWVITTAFYSTIYYSRHKIAPHAVNGSGKEIIYENFEELYQNFKRDNQNRHQFTVEWVSRNHRQVAAEFRFLFDSCNSARYINYTVSKTVMDDCVKALSKIKEYCLQ